MQVARSDATIDWRDRGDAGTELVARQAEDFVKHNSGKIRVTRRGRSRLADTWQPVITSMGFYSQCSHIRFLVHEPAAGNGFRAIGGGRQDTLFWRRGGSSRLIDFISSQSLSATFVNNSNGQDDPPLFCSAGTRRPALLR